MHVYIYKPLAGYTSYLHMCHIVLVGTTYYMTITITYYSSNLIVYDGHRLYIHQYYGCIRCICPPMAHMAPMAGLYLASGILRRTVVSLIQKAIHMYTYVVWVELVYRRPYYLHIQTVHIHRPIDYR